METGQDLEMVIYPQDRFELRPRQWTVSNASEIYQFGARATIPAFSYPQQGPLSQSRPTLTMESFLLSNLNFPFDFLSGINPIRFLVKNQDRLE